MAHVDPGKVVAQDGRLGVVSVALHGYLQESFLSLFLTHIKQLVS